MRPSPSPIEAAETLADRGGLDPRRLSADSHSMWHPRAFCTDNREGWIRSNSRPSARVGRPPHAWAAFLATLLTVLGSATAAGASPRDAQLSGLSCTACHSAGAQLNGIGNAWAAQVNRLEPIGQIPLVAVKGTVAYVSDGNGGGLSKTIVDYLDLYVNGKIATDVSYVFAQHAVDGGEPGFNDEAFISYRRPRSRYVAGAMVLPLPIDPERFRILHADDLFFSQTVGNNPFALKISHPLIGALSGDGLRGTEAGVFALAGHEAGSGVAQSGTDDMLTVTHRMPGLLLFALRYDGTRRLGSIVDRFWRSTYALVADRGPVRLDLAFGNGYDRDPAVGMPVMSSGGIAQLHVDLPTANFFELRYEGIADTTGTFVRQAVIGAGRSVTRNVRLTIEDAITRDTRTHNVLHVVAAFGASNSRVGGGY
jgi:hypothetical protein